MQHADNSYVNEDFGPLVVDIFLEGARAIGICRQVQERRRMIDVLNTQESVLELEDVAVFIAGSKQPAHYNTLAVVKHTIVAAVPRETQVQNRMRAVLTNVIGRQATARQHVSLIVPPLAIETDEDRRLLGAAQHRRAEHLARRQSV